MYSPSSLLVMMICIGCGAPDDVGQRIEPQVASAPPPQELTPAEAARIPPPPPFSVMLRQVGTATTITWQPSPLENVVAYRVYRKDPSAKRIKIGETSEARFVDRMGKPGTTYTVTAVNSYGAESPHITAKVKRD